MAEVVRMPKLSDTMEEGVVAEWHKKVGDSVESGDLLAEIETDKATMEFESFQDGTLLHIGVNKGEAAPVDGILAILGDKGEDISKLLKAESAPTKNDPEPKTEEKPATTTSARPVAPEPVAVSQPVSQPAPVANNTGRVIASPLAKKLAADKGIEISTVQGTGDGGRIVKRDIDNYVPAAQIAKSVNVGTESYTDVPASQMRKSIAKNLTANQFSAPHFYLTIELDMDNTIEARKQLNEVSPVKISFNDIVIKAVASALRVHPNVNSSWIAETNSVRTNHHVSVGVAMAVEDGLLVPVVKFTDQKNLSEISQEVKDFAVKAKNKKISLEELQGNTFTVSNLGMFGIEEFTSILNAPESCIMAIGAIRQVPVVRDGEMKIGNVMKVTLTCDHRTVDGASGAVFLQTFKKFVENPVTMMV
ncbi:MAG: pyruvate dehydrogenase complex dihydrolipoamide acetyltransferase [Crocinitomicaceae bacterium]|nr:pyruvate dehydrogenase complex dihydrolipoamide acetyltransferase [Crocinitomicaceae bacterium]|tara:strand:- start:10497 stop:11753 length:1257 start_codon:yes stop_codon:yes gene_type:complete